MVAMSFRPRSSFRREKNVKEEKKKQLRDRNRRGEAMARPSSSHGITITRGASPTAIGQPRSRFVAVLSAVLLVVACVAMAGSLGGRAGGAGSALDESEEYLRVPRRLANLAADHDDRDGLARIMQEGHDVAQKMRGAEKAKAVQQLQAQQQRERADELRYGRPQQHHSVVPKTKEEAQEEHAAKINNRVQQGMMRTSTMVPWVHWPKDDAEFATARTQSLLQMPAKMSMLAADARDEAAKVLPLAAIMNRLKVDHALHRGDVSDTQLAMMDEAAKGKKSAAFGKPSTALDCKPFC